MRKRSLDHFLPRAKRAMIKLGRYASDAHWAHGDVKDYHLDCFARIMDVDRETARQRLLAAGLIVPHRH